MRKLGQYIGYQQKIAGHRDQSYNSGRAATAVKIVGSIPVVLLVMEYKMSAVLWADRIIVMEVRRIVEQIFHDELVAMGHSYFDLVSRDLLRSRKEINTILWLAQISRFL